MSAAEQHGRGVRGRKPIKWQGDKLADLIRRARLGEGWMSIGKSHGVNPDAAAQVWFTHASDDDKNARALAMRRNHLGFRTSPAGSRIADGPLAYPRHDIFAGMGNCFQDDPRLVRSPGLLRLARPEPDYSLIGSSAAWVAGL